MTLKSGDDGVDGAALWCRYDVPVQCSDSSSEEREQ